jgi:hypothetical protein
MHLLTGDGLIQSSYLLTLLFGVVALVLADHSTGARIDLVRFGIGDVGKAIFFLFAYPYSMIAVVFTCVAGVGSLVVDFQNCKSMRIPIRTLIFGVFLCTMYLLLWHHAAMRLQSLGLAQ